MAKHSQDGIPVSVSLDENMLKEGIGKDNTADKSRIFYISLLAVGTGVAISFIAKALVYLINLITNLSFHHQFSIEESSPSTHNLGLFVILVPVLGGLVVGLMAMYGSKAIRGHGIPEAMEQILTNKSKIRPSITYLKPISSAISIGTGGPFGAEGPIIATGGALGSTLGQLLRISSYERKILLAAGATAGMSAIFGSPIAAIFLAIELLLFEFSPRSIIPVALACITGTAGHHLLFSSAPVFPMPAVEVPDNTALAVYSIIGLVVGLLSALVTKIVYFIEDAFEKLPVHWMWWPALGGLVVGIVGYVAPRTLGVGYDNITEILSGSLTFHVILSLCLFKFISWSVALGSGTSGGTLAPLLTIGSATGVLLADLVNLWVPGTGITLPLAALIGMSAMFAGASRAVLTSILFAIETTGQNNALLPLLAACVGSYFVSFFLMENTIMTEKIARRGVKTPHTYKPDLLDKLTVGETRKTEAMILGSDLTIEEARKELSRQSNLKANYFIVAGRDGIFRGIISSSNLFSMHHPEDARIETLIKRKPFAVTDSDTLKTAVAMMARENLDVLPVVSGTLGKISGVLSYKDILASYRHQIDESEESRAISLKRRTFKIFIHGRKKIAVFKARNKESSS